MGPAGGDAAIPGVKVVFIDAGAVRDALVRIGCRCWFLAFSIGWRGTGRRGRRRGRREVRRHRHLCCWQIAAASKLCREREYRTNGVGRLGERVCENNQMYPEDRSEDFPKRIRAVGRLVKSMVRYPWYRCSKQFGNFDRIYVGEEE